MIILVMRKGAMASSRFLESMERRMQGNLHVRCGAGEKFEK